ncbi:hypothetical protein KXX50_007872, partial [Aspergillus fumigatus]
MPLAHHGYTVEELYGQSGLGQGTHPRDEPDAYQSREIERPADLGYLEGGLGIASLRAPAPKRRH